MLPYNLVLVLLWELTRWGWTECLTWALGFYPYTKESYSAMLVGSLNLEISSPEPVAWTRLKSPVYPTIYQELRERTDELSSENFLLGISMQWNAYKFF